MLLFFNVFFLPAQGGTRTSVVWNFIVHCFSSFDFFQRVLRRRKRESGWRKKIIVTVKGRDEKQNRATKPTRALRSLESDRRKYD